MATITGNVKNHATGANVAGVTPILEKGDLTNWAPFSPSSLTGGLATDSSGNFSIGYTPEAGTFSYVRLSFRGSDGLTWPIAPGTGTDVTVWDRAQPPSAVSVRLLVPTLPLPTVEGTASTATPTVLSGTVVDLASASRGGVEVRLYGTASGSEQPIGAAVSMSDGGFTFPPLGDTSSYRSLRLEFGPAAAPYDVSSGATTWATNAAPSSFRYVVAVPSTPASAPTSSGVAISGTVRFVDGTPLPAVQSGRFTIRIIVWSTPIGAAEAAVGSPLSPIANGTYSTTATVPSGGLNLQAACQAEVSAGVWEEVARSELFPAVASNVVLDIVVSDERLRIQSEAASVAVVDTKLPAALVANPDLITPRDEQILAAALALPLDKVRRRTAAKRLKKQLDALTAPSDQIGTDILYALLCQRYPRQVRAFARRAKDRALDESALLAAVEQRILRTTALQSPPLSATLDRLTNLSRLFDRTFSLGDALANMVRTASAAAQLSDSQILTFVEAWHARTSPDQFWADLRSPLPSGWTTTTFAAAERAMLIIVTADRRRKTVQVFQNANANAPASWMAEIGLSGWQTLVASFVDADIPAYVTGPDLASRKAAWAGVVYDRAERRFPWAALRGEMVRALTTTPVLGTTDLADLRTFLTNQRKTVWHAATPTEFHLGDSHIQTFSPAPTATVADQLKSMQRLYALIPRRNAWAALRALWLADFRSARDVSRIGLQRFLFRMEQASPGAVEPRIASAMWRRARRRAQRAANFYRTNHPTRAQSHSPFVGPSSSTLSEIKPAAVAEVSTLYAQALCGCEHCQSVLSPAAYFVDTLFWLDDRGALQPLLTARPDLELLELDCENTETALPYSDLLVEILEQVVAGQSVGAAPHATEARTAELVAYPEHADRAHADAAYTALKAKFSPRNLPYHLALDEVRSYLAQAGVPHVELIDAFNPLATPPVAAVDRAVLALGGTTQSAAVLLVGGAPNPEILWGFPAPTASYVDVLYLLPELLARGQIDDFDIVLDLMRTRYLNADARLGVVLKPGTAADVDACDVEFLSVQRDKSATSTPAFVVPPPWLFARMAVFLRLMDWTGWPALTLDKALYALGVTGAEPGTVDNPPSPGVQLTSDRLIRLEAIAALFARTALEATELCSWWTGLDVYLDRENRADPVPPLYDQRFLDPFVVGAEGAATFALNPTRSELLATGSTSIVDTQPAALSSALRVEIGELQAAERWIEGRGEGAVATNLASLWRLFRWTSLARASGLTIEEVELWVHAVGSANDPFPVGGAPDPTRAVRWFDALGTLRQHGLSVSEIGWIFGHVGSSVAALGPTDAENEAALSDLRDALVALRAELASAQADEPTIRAALDEVGLAPLDIDKIIAIAVWEGADSGNYDTILAVLEPWVDSLVALKASGAMPNNPSSPVDRDARMSALLEHLQASTLVRRQRELVIGALGAAHETLTRAHAELLDSVSFTTLGGFTDPLGALHLADTAGWSLETATGLTAAEASAAHRALHLVAKLAHLVEALSLDAASFASWLQDPGVLGVPSLLGLPVSAQLTALDGLWATLEAALGWFGVDRAFSASTPTGGEIREAMRAGGAKSAITMVASRTGWDLSGVGALTLAMGAAWADLTVPAGPVPSAVSITVDGVVIQATPASGGNAGVLLTAVRDAVTAAAQPWLTAQTFDGTGGVPATPSAAVRLRLTTGSATHAPLDVLTASFTVRQGLYAAAPFDLVLERWRILARLGIDLPTANAFVTADPSRVRAAEARRVARAKYPSDAAWSPIGREIRDPIRRRQQAALYAAVRALPGGTTSDAEFYGKYFVDPAMDPCMLTTRLALAISSVQTYINRCLLAQQSDGEGVGATLVPLSSDDEAEWRGWRSSYRMWEAARKVFLFPENWLEPSLRVERSAQFEALEQRLLTEGLDERAAEEAMAAYLTDILPLGNPLPACMHTDRSGNLHLFARTGDQADQLHYRLGVGQTSSAWRWHAWERVPFPVPQDTRTRLACYVVSGTLIVVWTTATILSGQNSAQQEEETTTLGIQFAVRSGGEWSAPQQVHTANLAYAISAVHLRMYEHTEPSAVEPGLYVTLEHRNGPVGTQTYSGLVLRWSPSRRTFLPAVPTSLRMIDDDRALGYTGGQMAEHEVRSDTYTYYYTESLDARYSTSAPGENPPEQTVAVLWGDMRTSRLGDDDTTPFETEQFAVLAMPHESEPGEILLPTDYADWGSQGPFVVVHGSRSYLVLPA